MKFFALTILCVIGSAFARPGSSNELTSSEEKLIDAFVTNYAEEIDRYVKSALKDVAEAICVDKNTDLEAPLEEVIKRAMEVEDESETVCGLIQHHLAHVLEPFTKAVDACVPEDEAGVADYIVNAIVSVVSYICKSTGEQLLELANPCIDDIDLEEVKCIENVQEKWNEITSTTKSFKEETCKEYKEIRPCFETAIVSKCKLPITKESIIGLLDSVFTAPCAA